MATCEKCWGDAYLAMLSNGCSQAENYSRLLREREVDGVATCTQDEQDGQFREKRQAEREAHQQDKQPVEG